MATFSLQLVGALQIAIKLFCIKGLRPVTEHPILKSCIDPAQDNTCNLELKGKTQSEVGGEDCKVELKAEIKLKKGSRRKKKGSRGKQQAMQQLSLYHHKYGRMG